MLDQSKKLSENAQDIFVELKGRLTQTYNNAVAIENRTEQPDLGYLNYLESQYLKDLDSIERVWILICVSDNQDKCYLYGKGK